MPFTLVDLCLLVFVFLFFFFFFTPSFPLLHPKSLASSSSSSSSLSSSPPSPHPWRRATTAPSPSPSSSGPSSTRPIAASPASAIAPPTTAIGLPQGVQALHGAVEGAALTEAGMRRWEVGEIAYRIAQLYYGQYRRTSDSSYLAEAFVFYEAVLDREYLRDAPSAAAAAASEVALAHKQLRLLVRNLYSVVLSHYLYLVKGGWHQLEETINFLLLKLEEGKLLNPRLLRDIFKDLIGSLTEISSEENLIDELLINESSDNLLFPDIGLSSGFSFDGPQRDSPNDVRSAIAEILDSESINQLPRK
uniref:Uncharacterized protein n=1 Tax=Ananas comosus var. bracteatus TaxID=296719 RepID=A0A6V7NEH6_ANACO|nr:unnamed protein product [Ananas comosus var. bracteatus]